MLSVDLSDAYFTFQYILPFKDFSAFQSTNIPSSSSAYPLASRRLPGPSPKFIAYLRERGLRVYYYLVDILLLAESRQVLIQHREILLSTLQVFGWLVNWQKSKLQPTQKMVFLGAELDTIQNRVQLPQEKIMPLIQKI